MIDQSHYDTPPPVPALDVESPAVREQVERDGEAQLAAQRHYDARSLVTMAIRTMTDNARVPHDIRFEPKLEIVFEDVPRGGDPGIQPWLVAFGTRDARQGSHRQTHWTSYLGSLPEWPHAPVEIVALHPKGCDRCGR